MLQPKAKTKNPVVGALFTLDNCGLCVVLQLCVRQSFVFWYQSSICFFEDRMPNIGHVHPNFSQTLQLDLLLANVSLELHPSTHDDSHMVLELRLMCDPKHWDRQEHTGMFGSGQGFEAWELTLGLTLTLVSCFFLQETDLLDIAYIKDARNGKWTKTPKVSLPCD